MKTTILMALALTFTTSAFGAITTGTYAQKTQVIIKSAQTEKECKKLGGDWGGEDGDDGMCFEDAENLVEIAKAANNKYNLTVATISGGNGHSCEFEGEATLSADKKTLTSTVATTDYHTDEATTCTIEVKQVKAFLRTAVSVTESGNCREFCGANAYGLDIEKALKKIK
jgi:hypothetical protein